MEAPLRAGEVTSCRMVTRDDANRAEAAPPTHPLRVLTDDELGAHPSAAHTTVNYREQVHADNGLLARLGGTAGRWRRLRRANASHGEPSCPPKPRSDEG